MEPDGNSIVTRLCSLGFSQLEDNEQDWVIEMTRTRHPYWDPLIADAYLTRTSILNG